MHIKSSIEAPTAGCRLYRCADALTWLHWSSPLAWWRRVGGRHWRRGQAARHCCCCCCCSRCGCHSAAPLLPPPAVGLPHCNVDGQGCQQHGSHPAGKQPLRLLPGTAAPVSSVEPGRGASGAAAVGACIRTRCPLPTAPAPIPPSRSTAIDGCSWLMACIAVRPPAPAAAAAAQAVGALAGGGRGGGRPPAAAGGVRPAGTVPVQRRIAQSAGAGARLPSCCVLPHRPEQPARFAATCHKQVCCQNTAAKILSGSHMCGTT